MKDHRRRKHAENRILLPLLIIVSCLLISNWNGITHHVADDDYG